MAVRTIEFEVSANGITPATLQAAGVQGDHKSTKVIFNVETELYQSITQQATDQSGTAIYRIDGYDAEGGVSRSAAQNLTQNNIEYYLEEWLTRYGGNVKIVLVISILKDNTTEMELFSFPALLRLKNLPDGKDTSGENYESMSTLSEVARVSAEQAVEAAGKTEAARFALENGSTFIFDGNGTFGAVDPVFVVDSALSEQSENAIMNKAVATILSPLVAKVTALETKVNLMRDKTRIYMSDTDENPADIYGGTWERIKSSFLWGIDDGESAGVTGGEKTHTLTEDELPNVSGTFGDFALQDINQLSPSVSGNFSVDGRVGGYQGYGTSVEGTKNDKIKFDFGKNQPHNNMPPYYGVYIWIRKD